jgi:DNA-3-methyladenine glycosylase II
MARLIERVGPFAIRSEAMHSPFQSLLRAIVYQQLSGKAAATILGRVVALCPRKRPQPQHLLELEDAALRGAGLSRNKLLALRDLAAKTIDGTVPTLAQLRRLDDDEIVTRLTAVRGIGRWTVEMMLMFRLGRADVFPVADLGVRKGFHLTFGALDKLSRGRKKDDGIVLPAPKALLAYGERWRPYRSVASWYLWRAVDLEMAARTSTKKP